MSLRGNPNNLRDLAKAMRAMPLRTAQAIAVKVAPTLTDLTQSAWDRGVTVYGEPRPLGVNGNELSLVRTGAAKGRARFVAIGTVVRANLGTRYAKYLIGKYTIMPRGAEKLPVSWRAAIGNAARTVILNEQLGQVRIAASRAA